MSIVHTKMSTFSMAQIKVNTRLAG